MEHENIFGLAGVITIVIITLFLAMQYQNNVISVTNNPNSSNTGINSSTITLTTNELAKHNSAQSCWLLIENKIYDATNYASIHPGGADRITNFCGKDATQAFLTKGGRGSHSQNAFAQLGVLYIGELNNQVDLNSTVPQNAENVSKFNSNSNNEYEDD
jgi:cytochrome b involved in lipid metabolism